jgi:hypothetical protein
VGARDGGEIVVPCTVGWRCPPVLAMQPELLKQLAAVVVGKPSHRATVQVQQVKRRSTTPARSERRG